MVRCTMKETSLAIFNDTLARFPELEVCKVDILRAIDCFMACYKSNNKILVCGNGGSAADAEHIVGELMKGFLLPRNVDTQFSQDILSLFGNDGTFLSKTLQQPIPAISLVSQSALMTAFGNDRASEAIFAQQVYGYGCSGDVLLALSTSGNSQNVKYACQIAKYKNMPRVLLTGRSGGILKNLCDVSICVPSDETYKIQEFHLPVYHCICAYVENELFGS